MGGTLELQLTKADYTEGNMDSKERW